MARSKTDHIIVHCAATSPGMDIGRVEIDRWHRQKGFIKIGYHFVIRRNGWLEVGRDMHEPGAHARGYNHRSIGICLVGGVDDDGNPSANFTASQWETLRSTLIVVQRHFPDAKIIGHNEISNKACPSFDVQAWLKHEELPCEE